MLKREDATLGCAVRGWVKTKQTITAKAASSHARVRMLALLLDSSAMRFSATSELLWRDGAKAIGWGFLEDS